MKKSAGLNKSAMSLDEITGFLKSQANPAAVKGMARFGISSAKILGVSIPVLRKLAGQTGKNHQLALQLWSSGVHEARILAGMIDAPDLVSPEQMDMWAEEFDSWDICDQVCMNLFARTPHACIKAIEWSSREEEFVKRAGFAIMACVAWSGKNVTDDQVKAFLAAIERESYDERNFVKKAINWALRQIGKRNISFNKLAIECAKRVGKQDSKSAHWIASDALRELTGEQVQARLSRKSA